MLAVAAYLEIVRNYFLDDPFSQIYFITTVCPAIFLILETASIATVKAYMEEWIFRTGSLEEKRVIMMSREYQDLLELIDGIDPEHLQLFSHLLSHQQKEYLSLEETTQTELVNFNNTTEEAV